MKQVITAVVDEARGLAEDRKITLSVDGVDAGSVHCSLGILSSLVSNLVTCACAAAQSADDCAVCAATGIKLISSRQQPNKYFI